MSATTSANGPPAATNPPSNGNSGGGGGGPTSSPLLFFVALGFGVVFTNLWIIVGVKYCFRYNQRNRRNHHDENGEPIDLTALPRTHRRRREKKLMTMEEVNDRFPLTKYKAWMATRAEEGLPTAGGVALPRSAAASLHHAEGPTSTELDRQDSHDKRDFASPPSSPKQGTHESEKGAIESPQPLGQQQTVQGAADSSTGQTAHEETSVTTQPTVTPAGPSAQTPAGPPTRQEVHNDSDMDDDDQIQIAVPTELLANPGDSCAICIDTLEDDDDVRGLTCGHAFHASCLDPWLTSRRACCPLCKADYYIPKPRPEGEAAAEADRHAGRRPQGMSGARIDAPRPTHYAFMGRRDGRSRMILPGRFMTIGHFDDGQTQRHGSSTAQRMSRLSRRDQGQEAMAPEIQNDQPNTWRSRLTSYRVPRMSMPRFGRNNASPNAQTAVDTNSDSTPAVHNTTPGDLEAGTRN
ncbi:MAG: hypothetical protein LQ350_004221 [Teloschistes chrysophthalmus]|nr:MAG: hypothetical protein LQ350_004221 [Niorma chrysophthalma]